MKPEWKIPEDRQAGENKIWQCQACGKFSDDLYGLIGFHSANWDESCMMNALSVPKVKED